ncbi:tRNA (adenosine(37)-N6)-dimethylallyltransferase MiaA [Chryseomicrobium palamuruense]|uniref:tRNA dimethylallyltransferase n=1 Tax=Chryseomicrobium palamuruense TaxID=682973 RepID=A0ABV8UTW8_9BACL
MKKQKVLVLAGPTASGKTALSIELAKRFNGEIINGDAFQVYKGLDIGTAKVTTEEMEGIPHHLLSLREPSEAFSVAEYQKLVRMTIEDITSRGHVPILVGGTGLYIQAVLYDFQFVEQAVDTELRQQLEQLTSEELWGQLSEQDPEAAQEIHPNNKQRVVRALERVIASGVNKQEAEQNRGKDTLYSFVIFGLERDRQELYQRINTRVYLMIANGLVEEVKELLKRTPKDAQAFQAIGYKEVISHLEGRLTHEEMIAEIQQNSRRYAKRQFTYFRNKLPVEWVHPEEDYVKIVERCNEFLKGNENK